MRAGRVGAMLVLVILPLFARGGSATARGPQEEAQAALSADASRAEAAIRALRAEGPSGLETFLDVHRAALAACDAEPSAACERLHAALDRVAGQRGAARSRLFWYTDLAAAQAAARRSGRPILSLHLLGRLDEDWSCANSRFFRTLLYADPGIASVLRERFVLHWKSLRPSPRVTIDFGDGRRLERTLTGNSLHYVLSPEGRPIDALPGLYGPGAFLAGLAEAGAAARAYTALPDGRREALLREHHRQRLAALSAQVGGSLELVALARAAEPPEPAGAGSSLLRADAIAPTKSMGQRVLLADALGAEEARPRPDAAIWTRLAVRYRELSRLCPEVRARVAREVAHPARAIERLETRLAEDSARNELGLHRRLHGWFADGSAPSDLDRLNQRVYGELFLMPEADAWDGLSAADVYLALPGGGRTPTR